MKLNWFRKTIVAVLMGATMLIGGSVLASAQQTDQQRQQQKKDADTIHDARFNPSDFIHDAIKLC